MTFEPNLVSQGTAGSHFKHVLEIRWLSEGWNLVLHRKLLSLRGRRRPIVMVQDPILFSGLFHWISFLRHFRTSIQKVKFTVCLTGTNSHASHPSCQSKWSTM